MSRFQVNRDMSLMVAPFEKGRTRADPQGCSFAEMVLNLAVQSPGILLFLLHLLFNLFF